MSEGLTAAVLGAGLVAMVADLNTAGLATGDPGSAGTTDPSSVTTKEDLTWPGSATDAVIAASNEPEWSDWQGSSGEVVSWITLWSTGGTFGGSMQLGSSVTMDTGDSLTLTEVQISSAAAIAS